MRFLALASLFASCALLVGDLAFADNHESPVLQQGDLQVSCPGAECPASTQGDRTVIAPQDTDVPVFPGHFATPFFPGCSYPGDLAVANTERVFGKEYWSADSGAMWTRMADPPGYGGVYNRTTVVAPSPEFDQDRTLFIGGEGSQAVWRSVDGGWSWQSSDPIIAGPVRDIEVSPAFASDGTVFAVTAGSIRRSTDYGVTWQAFARPPSTSPNAEMLLSSRYATDNTVVVRLNDGALWRTQDSGANWTRADTGLGTAATALDVAAVGSSHVALLAATTTGLAVSYDFGDTWSTLSSESFSVIKAPDQPGPALRIFALRDSQAVVTNDSGLTWSPVSSEWNLRDLALSPSFAHDQTIYICGDFTLLVSHDAGTSWQKRPTVTGQYENYRRLALVASPQFEDDGVMFAVPEYEGSLNWFLRSTDGGVTWTRLTLPDAARKPLMALSPAFATDLTAFLALGQQVYRSDDRGDSWTPIGAPLPSGINALSVSPGFSGDGRLFVAAADKGLFRCDGGGIWNLISGEQFTGRFITDLDISPGYPGDPTIFVSAYNDGIFRSDDGGSTWTNVTPFYRIRLAVALSPAFTTDHTLFIGETGFDEGGAYVSHDRGQTWTAIGGGLMSGFVDDLASSPQFAKDQTVVYVVHPNTPIISEDAGATWSRMTGIPRGTYTGSRNVALTIVDGVLVPWASVYADVYRYQWPLTLSRSEATVAVRAGSTTPVETNLRLWAEGPEQATWTASEEAGWLSLNPVAGNLPATLTLTIDPTQLTTTSRTEVTISVPWTSRQTQHARVPVAAYYFSHDLWLPLVTRGATLDIRSSYP
jgi:photosystem II stability/assembly factor-like uncharacterized protein